MYDVYVSVGSNLDPRRHIVGALRDLSGCPAVALEAISPVYRTRPVDVEEGAPPFHNLCLHLRTERPPGRLKELLRRLEDRRGRDRSRNGGDLFSSRVLDLDILLYQPSPTDFRPHRQIHEEPFVVYPLSDILDPAGTADLPSGRSEWRARCDRDIILGRVEYDWPEPLDGRVVQPEEDPP